MDARKVAEYIVKKYYISNPKLQNVLYFIQAKYLLENNEPCFEQPLEARSTKQDPWRQAYENFQPEISLDSMREYFLN